MYPEKMHVYAWRCVNMHFVWLRIAQRTGAWEDACILEVEERYDECQKMVAVGSFFVGDCVVGHRM
jgi:hypothetical protein